MRALSGVCFVGVSLAALIAACGPVATNEMHPILEVLEGSKSAAVSSSAMAPVDAPPPRPGGEKNTSVIASRLGKELTAIGLDPAHLPPMRALGMDKKKALMPIFAKALGYAKEGDPGCGGCHAPSDFKAETRNRAIAREMYDRWCVELGVLVPSSGAPTTTSDVFCDSCHASSPKVIDRTDSNAVKRFMKTEYVDKLVRKTEGDTTCVTCHGSYLELAIFDKVWKVPPATGAGPPAASTTPTNPPAPTPKAAPLGK